MWLLYITFFAGLLIGLLCALVVQKQRPHHAHVDATQRLMRMYRLLGADRMDRIRKSRVAVIGLGAVGSFATEALARSGVGTLTLVDFDTVEPSNLNRQLFALTSTIGKAKSELARNRVLDINPSCNVRAFQVYADRDSFEQIDLASCSLVVDAIDAISAKAALIRYCCTRHIPILSSMGAALRQDPLCLRIGDLFDAQMCPLAAGLRKRLWKHGIARGMVRCVYSIETPSKNFPLPGLEKSSSSSSSSTSSPSSSSSTPLSSSSTTTNSSSSSSSSQHSSSASSLVVSYSIAASPSALATSTGAASSAVRSSSSSMSDPSSAVVASSSCSSSVTFSSSLSDSISSSSTTSIQATTAATSRHAQKRAEKLQRVIQQKAQKKTQREKIEASKKESEHVRQQNEKKSDESLATSASNAQKRKRGKRAGWAGPKGSMPTLPGIFGLTLANCALTWLGDPTFPQCCFPVSSSSASSSSSLSTSSSSTTTSTSSISIQASRAKKQAKILNQASKAHMTSSSSLSSSSSSASTSSTAAEPPVVLIYEGLIDAHLHSCALSPHPLLVSRSKLIARALASTACSDSSSSSPSSSTSSSASSDSTLSASTSSSSSSLTSSSTSFEFTPYFSASIAVSVSSSSSASSSSMVEASSSSLISTSTALPTVASLYLLQSTCISEWPFIAQCALRSPAHIIPFFGIHPWFLSTPIAPQPRSTRTEPNRHTVPASSSSSSSLSSSSSSSVSCLSSSLASSASSSFAGLPDTWIEQLRSAVLQYIELHHKNHSTTTLRFGIGEIGVDRMFAARHKKSQNPFTRIEYQNEIFYQQMLLAFRLSQLMLTLSSSSSCLSSSSSSPSTNSSLQETPASPSSSSSSLVSASSASLCTLLSIPVSIHCVQAWQELLQTFKRLRQHVGIERLNRVMIHRFSANWSVAEQLLPLGVYLSISPHEHDQPSVKEVIERMPLDRLLIESDDESGRPSLVALAQHYAEIARIRKMDVRTLLAAVRKNMESYLGASLT